MVALEFIAKNNLVLDFNTTQTKTYEIAQYMMLIMFIFTRIIRSFDNLLENDFNALVLQQKIDNANSFMEVILN